MHEFRARHAESLFELSFECLLENPLSFCLLPCISAFSGILRAQPMDIMKNV